MAVRPGFLIPNANTYAPDYQAAQPDAGDFLIVGNTSTGVVLGCEVTFAGLTASLGSGPHIIVLDGITYVVTGNQSVSITGKGALPRWDLIVFDANHGGFGVLAGVPAASPVYADITDSMVVLAAVFVPITGGNDPHCIDKRNFLSRSVVGSDTGTLLKSYDGVDPRFSLDGNGKSTWGLNDTTLEEEEPGVLRVSNELRTGILTADDSATVNGYDVITTDHIQWGHGVKPVVGNDVGDLFVDDETGDLSVWLGSGWSTGYTVIPTGTIIMSMEDPTELPGWLPLWGGTYSQFQTGNLWSMHPEWISGGLMTLPDMRDRFPMGAGTGASAAGSPHGTLYDHNGTIISTISLAQMPSHSHQSLDSETGAGGAHSHTGTAQSGGAIDSLTTNNGGLHGHYTWDPGHVHTWSNGWPLVETPYGDSSLDNLFPDDEHHGTQAPSLFSDPAQVGMIIIEGGVHQHTTPPIAGHTHALNTVAAPTHTHPMPAHSAAGGGQPVTFTPPSLSINFYIKI